MRPRWVEFSAWIGILAAALAVFAGAIVAFPLGQDQAIFTLCARSMMDGGVLYRDVWDAKPPGIFIIYAVADLLFGKVPWGIRVLEVAAYGAMTVVMVLFSRRMALPRMAGVLGAAAVLHSVVAAGYWHSAQAESFGGVLVLGTLFLLWPEIRPAGSGPWGSQSLRFFVAGLACGYCGLIKPFYVVPGLVCALWALRGAACAGGAPARAWVRALLAFAAGGGLFPAIVFGVLGAQGGLAAFAETLFVVAPALAAGHPLESTPLERFFHALRDGVGVASLLVPIGLVLLATFGRERLRDVRGGFWATFLASLVAVVAVQGKFYPYHFHLLLPVFGMLAGWGWWAAWERARCSHAGVVAVPGVFAALLFVATGHEYQTGTRWWRTAIASASGSGREALLWPVPRDEVRSMAAWLRARTVSADTVQVLGFDPLLYIYSERRPAAADLTGVLLRPARTRVLNDKKLAAGLAHSAAAAIVVVRCDGMPWTLDNVMTTEETLRECPAMQEFIAGGYVETRATPHYRVYLRRDGVAEP